MSISKWLSLKIVFLAWEWSGLILFLADYLASRSWKGLEQKQGETPVTKAVHGRAGLAAGYSHEKGLNQESQENLSSEWSTGHPYGQGPNERTVASSSIWGAANEPWLHHATSRKVKWTGIVVCRSNVEKLTKKWRWKGVLLNRVTK